MLAIKATKEWFFYAKRRREENLKLRKAHRWLSRKRKKPGGGVIRTEEIQNTIKGLGRGFPLINDEEV